VKRKGTQRGRGRASGFFGGVIMLILIFAACDQYPLLYQISQEDKPKDSKIPGSSSKIVRGEGGKLYTANGDLWEFNGDTWEEIISRNGKDTNEFIRDAAASEASSGIYFLTVDNSKGGMTKIYKNDFGVCIAEGGNLKYQTIFFENGVLFAGTTDDNQKSYYITRLAGDSPSKIDDMDGLLSGVVFVNGSYYFATGTGLWKCDSGFNGAARLKEGGNEIVAGITGIIKIKDDYLAAVSGGGAVYQIKTDDDAVTSAAKVFRWTGALEVWTNPDAGEYSGKQLLLAGVDSGDDTGNGYREIEINAGGTLNFDSFAVPGISASKLFSSVETEYAKYQANIGNRIINSIIQINGTRLMFAATQKNGLFSYRNQAWNGEE